MAKILFIGDVVGKAGRKVLREVLPKWKEEYKPDVTIVNVENLAHGKGVTPATLAEVDALDVDCFTSGNHIFKKGELSKDCFEKYPKLIRPANFDGNLPGHGYYRFSKPVVSPFMGSTKAADKSANYKDQQFLILNLNGQVFMEKQFDGNVANPFLALDKLIVDQGQKDDIIIVDFHAEATSEKVAMGIYANGRVAGVFGTHTHIPTADARILSAGTAYISDVGMVGTRDSVLGVVAQNALTKFLEKGAFKNEVEEEGILQINGVLVETRDKGQATRIEKLYKEISS